MSNIHGKPYRNWVRGALGLLYVQEGLYPFTDSVVKAEHGRILQNLATCTSCTVRKIEPAHASGNVCSYDYRNRAKCNCRKKGNRACNTCGQLYDEIITRHRFKDPLWVTDSSTWCTDHWQIAKCFMTTTTQGSNNTAAETDAAGLLSIIINGVFFQSDVQCNIDPPHDIFSQVRQIRNSILHNSTLELSDTEVIGYLQAMITVLEDQKTLINDPSAKAAVRKLREIMKDELVVTTKEEAKAIQTALRSITETTERGEESIRSLTNEKLKELDERNKKIEERLREFTKEGENLFKKTTEQCKENVKNLTDEKHSLHKQSLDAKQDIETAKETAVAEVRSAVSLEFAEEYEPERKRLKLEHDAHEKRIIAIEKKQSDLEVNQQKEQDVSSTIKHQARLDYLKQKKDLQQRLVELYQNYYVKTWLSPLKTADNDVNISDVYVSPKMVVEEKYDKDKNKPEVGLTQMKTNKVSENTACLKEVPIDRYRDIFCSGDGKINKKIYIIGDVGTGKSSFCKMMMQNWCRSVTEKTENKESDGIGNEGVGPGNDDNTRDISAFKFLFYVPLHCMSGNSNDLAEMIKAQLEKKFSSLIDQIFLDESECCLILADGLDEWTPPQTSVPRLPHIAYGLPTFLHVRSATIITTSRPSARGILDMKSTEYDLKVKLLGVKETEGMIKKYMSLLDKSPFSVNDLNQTLDTLNLKDLQRAPMLLQQIIWMYNNNYTIGESITKMYTNIVNITLGWMHEKDMEWLAITNVHKTAIGQLPLPKGFENYSRCQEERDLIIILGKAAYDIFIGENTSTVVLDRYRLKRLGLTDNDISAVLQVGILNEVKSVDPTFTKSQLSFIHTSYLEFFAAVYISSYCLAKTQTSQSNLIQDLIPRKSTAAELLRLENVLVMVCGLSPIFTNAILECIYKVSSTDKQLVINRKSLNYGYSSQSLVRQIQDTCIRCVSESNSTDKQQQLCLNLCDYLVNTDEELNMYLSNVNSVNHLKIDLFGHYFMAGTQNKLNTSLSKFFSEAVSLETLYISDLIFYKDERDDHIIFDLSRFQQLQRLKLVNVNKISVSNVAPTTNLKSCEISGCQLSHEECTLLSEFLTNAISLESLHLEYNICIEDGCDVHIIDLSRHQQLQKVYISDCRNISVSGVTPTTNLKSFTISRSDYGEHIHRLSHEQCTSLSAFLSHATSLESLHLSNIECMKYNCEGHIIDLSRHQQLQKVEIVSCITLSVSGVTPDNNLKSFTIWRSDCEFGLSHEQFTSLSSFLSQAISLESLYLEKIKCFEDGCDGHIIDLSRHQQLQMVYISDCENISVSGVTPTTNLKSFTISRSDYNRDTHMFSHEQYTSLSSFLSQAISLESLHLEYVVCIEDGCDAHIIDLSRHQQLQTVDISVCDNISVSGVTPTTNLKSFSLSGLKYDEYTIRLSHEQCTSLSSFLSQAISLESLHLEKVECIEDGCDGHIIDLSRHQQLRKVYISDCDNMSVSGVTPTTNLMSFTISRLIYNEDTHKFSHEQNTSLSSFLSQAISLESLYLEYVVCIEDGCDCHIIDLSRHQQLQTVDISDCDMSVSGVTPTTNLKSFTLSRTEYYEGTLRLSHEQYTSLSSFLSQAISLESLYLKRVKCIEDGCDGHIIDLSRHQQLQTVVISYCDMSVSGVTPTTNLKSFTLSRTEYYEGTLRLSHEQYTSLSSFLSQAISLESLYLERVKCIEDGCDGHIIDLSRHQQLQTVVISYCDMSVSGVTPTTNLKTTKKTKIISNRECHVPKTQPPQNEPHITQKCTPPTHTHAHTHTHIKSFTLSTFNCDEYTIRLSHEKCTSLSSFLSQAISLESLDLERVKCIEDGCDGHIIDLSRHQQLRKVYISLSGNISVSGVTPTTNLESCTISSLK